MSKDKDNAKNSDDVNTQPVKKQKAENANLDEAITQPVVKPKEDLDSGEDVLDPLTLRDSDTSKLKRVKPKSATQTVNLDSENVSDTVHLKVIKEKKKQLAGILTASQTIRLRPPASPQQPPAGGASPGSSQTLKINPSASPAGSGTVNMPPAGAGSPAGTLKINMPASSSESGTIKVSKPNFAESSSAGTLKIKNPGAADTAASGSGTLKIKSAAPSTASASGTLKLKAAAPAPADETVKIGADGGGKGGGTVKLKAKSTVNQKAPASGRSTSAVEEEEAFAVEDPKAKPGIWMTLSSLVAIAAVGTIVFLCIDNYMELFSVLKK